MKTNESDQWSSQSSEPPTEHLIRPSAKKPCVITGGQVHSITMVQTPKGRMVRVVGRGVILSREKIGTSS